MGGSEYQWLVVRGRVSLVLRLDEGCVELTVDPEGSWCCQLSFQDAKEISQILGSFAEQLWTRFESDKALHGPAETFTFNEDFGSVTWPTDSGALQLQLNADRDLISIGQAASTYRLRISQLVEVIQFLGLMASRSA